ncbi:MAG: hypothetical protein MO852_03535 [Candidatus Devosia euplotis]|nr:hypothetical protein [Candidatus Devosia euplotis]
MDDTPRRPPSQTVDNGMLGFGVVLAFAGRGGAVRHEPSVAEPAVLARGFKLVSGNSKSLEFKV